MTQAAVSPRPLPALTALAIALTGLSLIWLAFDARLVEGSATSAKPMKFAISFAVFFGTLALAEQRFSPAWRKSWLFWTLNTLLGAAFLFEMSYMIFQGAQGQTSHFNTGTAFTGIMCSLMGVAAVILVVCAGVFGWAALRDKDANFGPALRLGIGMGFIGSCVLTLITAGTMSSMAGHTIGTPGPSAATIPLMGWSATLGDLRPAHFVALHMMQALPLLGLWIDRRGGAVGTIRIVAIHYVMITIGLFAQALMGLPVIRL